MSIQRFSLVLFLMVALTIADKYLYEDFDGVSWGKRWVSSERIGPDNKPLGDIITASGTWSSDLANRALITATDMSHYRVGSALSKPFTDKTKPFIFHFTVKQDVKVECGGGNMKLMDWGVQMDQLDGNPPFHIRFGPDFCGTATRHVLFSIQVDGKEYELKEKIRAPTDRRTHAYTLKIFPDGAFHIGVDAYSYPYKKFTLETHMPDLHKDHPNWQVPVLGSVVIDVWQVKSGMMFDNMLITDTEDELLEWVDAKWNAKHVDEEWKLLSSVIQAEKILNQKEQANLLEEQKRLQRENAQKLQEIQDYQAERRRESAETLKERKAKLKKQQQLEIENAARAKAAAEGRVFDKMTVDEQVEVKMSL